MDCQCHECCYACVRKPGWFFPGEAEKAAALLGLSLQEFFDEYLGVDYFVGKTGDPDIFVLAPAIITMETGQVYPFDPHGQCVFYQSGKCAIHAAKPKECAVWDHSVSSDETLDLKNNVIVQEWVKHQDQIEKLLGKKPAKPHANVLDVLSLMMSGIKHDLASED